MKEENEVRKREAKKEGNGDFVGEF